MERSVEAANKEVLSKEDMNVEEQSTGSETGVKMSKKLKEKIEKKFKKKIAQAQAVIVRAEQRDFDQLFSVHEPTQYLLITHFGNGDEIDQSVLHDTLATSAKENGGKLKALTIFPGCNYGHCEFESANTAALVMKMKDQGGIIDSPNCVNLAFPGADNSQRIVVMFYSKLAVGDLKKSENIEIMPAMEAKTNAIPGLYVFDEFITPEQEAQLVKEIDANKWEKLLNRRVQHFGYEFKYGTNNVDTSAKIGALPAYCNPLTDKMEAILGNFEAQADGHADNSRWLGDEGKGDYFERHGMFDQLTLNDYQPGQGIPPHVDTHSPFEEIFASLSLISGVTMHFKTPEGKTIDLYLRPRSLILFTGEVRFNWLHSIATRKIDKVYGSIDDEEVKESELAQTSHLKFRHRRVSLTFRKVRSEQICRCKFPKLCDTQSKEAVAVQENLLGGMEGEAPVYKASDAQPKTATNMEKEHVYDVYEKIAPHFSNTRYKPWPRVEAFLNDVEPGSLVADVGCGNGKYLGVNEKNLFTIGTDRSFNLIDICKQKSVSYQTFVADSLKLPVRSDTFDRVISIAVIHHFSTDSLRIQALEEIYRIMRVGALCLVYVWAYEQEHKKFQQQDVFVKWNLQNSYTKNKGSKLEDSQQSTEEKTSFIETGLRDDTRQSVVYHRYYHMFMKGELEKLIEENFAGRLLIKDNFFDHANWVVICEKLK